MLFTQATRGATLTLPSLARLPPLPMQAAAALLTRYIQLLADDGVSVGAIAAPYVQNAQGDRKPNGAAEFLMAQAQKGLAEDAEFQTLLAQLVPKALRLKAQQRLLRRLYTCKKPDQLAAWVKQELSRIVPSIQADEAMIALIQQIQTLPGKSRDRRNLIQTLLIEIQTSDRLKQHLPNLPPELYADALHNTLLWFCDHLDSYDPTLSGPITWFNRNLFYQGMKIVRSLNRPLPHRFTATAKTQLEQGGPDAYDTLMVEAEYQILDDLYQWVDQDATGRLKRTALTDRLDINVQTVVKAALNHIRTPRSQSASRSATQSAVHQPSAVQPYALFSEQPSNLSQLFDHLSSQLDHPPEKLRRFWREKCKPCIEDFLQESGNR